MSAMKPLLWLLLAIAMCAGSAGQDWPLWKSYASTFMDNQIRVIDRDAGDRTTSEAQAYGMFFALVANDRARFDGLLRWTETNLASGDLTAHLPAWLWGKGPKKNWGVLDSNPAADADLWLAYSLIEAGKAWNEPRYSSLGSTVARRIADQEVAEIPSLGTMLLPAPQGFHRAESYRLNASYVPLQVLLRLAQEFPDGPWQRIAAGVPALVSSSAPHGFATDWIEYKLGGNTSPSPLGSYDAIRVYLWAGMLHPATPGRDLLLKALSGMTRYLHANPVPPEKIRPDGSVQSPKGPVGFSAAVLPFVAAVDEKDIENQQMSRVSSEFSSNTGLYGNPAKYYDQNLALFALGWKERQFWFDSHGNLKTNWKTVNAESLGAEMRSDLH
jgi:endoglucanase